MLHKHLLLLLFLLSCLLQLNGQKRKHLKLGIEAGILPFSKDRENLGLLLNIEPKIEVLKNTYLGLRLGVNINSHTFENNSTEYFIDERFDNGVLSFVPTIDYYLNESNFQPYLGLGLGYYLLSYPIEIYRFGVASTPEDALDGNVKKRIGFLVRSGVELGKLRLGIAYNLVPKGDIKLQNSQIIGTVENSYWGLSIGYIISTGSSSADKQKF